MILVILAIGFSGCGVSFNTAVKPKDLNKHPVLYKANFDFTCRGYTNPQIEIKK